MQEAQPGEAGPLRSEGITFIDGAAMRMDDFSELLSQRLGRLVLDQTGLKKAYDIKVNWKADSAPAPQPENLPPATLPNPSPAVIINALQTQIGLTAKLEQRPVEVFVVDRVRPPKDLLAVRKPIPMDPHLFEAYVGNYEIPGDLIMTVSHKNDHFWLQLQGQPQIDLYPDGPRHFFVAAADAQILFNLDPRGRVTELVLHQGGQDFHAPRMDDTKAKQRIDKINGRIGNKVPTPRSEEAARQYGLEGQVQ
jgi:hypothetical protein